MKIKNIRKESRYTFFLVEACGTLGDSFLIVFMVNIN